MISRQLGFTVLSAPVASCDRRALSEAWFSALHLHKDRPQPSRDAGAPSSGRAKGPQLRLPASDARNGVPQYAFQSKRSGAITGAVPGPAADRRVNRSALARKIEHAFVRQAIPPKQASFALEGDRGRVQILLRNSGGSMQIIALCPPAARDVVARALAEARYALSMRGIQLHAGVRGFAQ